MVSENKTIIKHCTRVSFSLFVYYRYIFLLLLSGYSPFLLSESSYSVTRNETKANTSSAHNASMEDEEFNTLFLHGDQSELAGIFLYSNKILPGLKEVNVSLNQRNMSKQTINFVVNSETNRVEPCFNREVLETLGVKTTIYSGWSTRLNKDATGSQCDVLSDIIPHAKYHYDDATQSIQLQLPQEAIRSDILKMISPDEWDHGVSSLRLNYDGYVYRTRFHGASNQDQTNAYFSLGSTATLGAWRFYSYDTFSKASEQDSWDSNHDRAYAIRDIPAIHSKIQLGDIYTYSPSNILGVLPLRGVTLATNSNMMADNQYRYAPVIRGTARTNARVIVRQRGNIIYSTTVTPGNFAIEDMYSGQIGADLHVTVEEADGTSRVFNVPYTSLPNMLRPNSSKYSVSIGQYRDKNVSDKPTFAALTYEHGFEPVTVNTAILGANDYQAASLGAAWNIGNIGAFSVDAAYARYQNLKHDQFDEKNTGTAIRFLYAKQFEATRTGLRILGYQYRSKHFLELSEYVNLDNKTNTKSTSNWSGLYQAGTLLRRRSRLEANLNQGLGDYGSLYLTAYYDRYYNSSEASRSVTAGYSTNIGKVTASVDYSHHQYGGSDSESQINLQFSLPFSWGKSNYGSVGYALMRNNDNRYSQSLSTNGTLDKNRFTYSLNVMKDHQSDFTESLSLGYNASYGNVMASVSHSKNSTQLAAGLGGGVLLYRGGVVLSQRLGDTVAIVETPDASGVGVSSNLNISTDYWGRAVVPYITAYRYNNIELNLDNTKSDVELLSSAQKVVPSAGATVVAKFGARVGRRAIVAIQPSNNRRVPLATPVYLSGKNGLEEVGMVGHNSEAYLTGLNAKQAHTLLVKWGDEVSQQCEFTLPALTKEQQKNQDTEWYKTINADCH